MTDRERVSIVTDEISQDLAEVRAFLGEHDLHLVELRTVRGRRVPDLDPRDEAVLRAWARDGDPAVLGVSPGLFKGPLAHRAEARRQLAETLPASIDLAHRLGARFLVTFGFDSPGGAGPGDFAAESLAAAAEACGRAGLPLLLENEPGSLAFRARDVHRLLLAAGHENLFVNWDPLNGNEFGRAELREGARLLLPRMRHVHVKNGRLLPGELFARCGPLREGAIDWGAHLRDLHDLGYRGTFGVETHFEPLREGSALVLRELRDLLAEAGFEGEA